MKILPRYLPAYASLSVAAILIVPVSTLEPLWLTVIAALTTLAALLGAAIRGNWPNPNIPLTGLMGMLIIWGIASMIWSIGPDRSALQAFELFLFATGATVLIDAALGLDATERQRLEAFLMIGFALGLLFVLFELATDGIGHSALNGHFASDGTQLTPAMNLVELNRASSVFSLMVWVTVIPVWRCFGWSGATALVVITWLAISQLQPGAPILAVIVGATIFALAWYLPRFVLIMLLVAVLVGLAMIPLIPILQPILTDLIRDFGLSEFSLHHRIAIWQFASEHVAARPFAGWGLDSSRLIGAGQLVTVNDAPNVGFRDVDILPLHPHNAFLQAWLELGIVGALLLASIFTATVLIIRRHVHGRLERAAAYAAYSAAFINAQLSFGIWQGWWISTLVMVAILLTALVAQPRPAGGGGSA